MDGWLDVCWYTGEIFATDLTLLLIHSTLLRVAKHFNANNARATCHPKAVAHVADSEWRRADMTVMLKTRKRDEITFYLYINHRTLELIWNIFEMWVKLKGRREQWEADTTWISQHRLTLTQDTRKNDRSLLQIWCHPDGRVFPSVFESCCWQARHVG